MIFRLVNLDECSNCERLEADLEREQEAGLMRKADLAFAHECVATAELCRDGFKVERDNVTARLWRFVQDARMTLLCFDGEYGEPSPAQRKACISLIQDTLESIKEIAE